MKICYIAPYRDGTGYAKASLEYIMSLDAVGVDVVARPVKMTNSSGQIPERVLELEDKNLNGVDVVIQHNLPSEFSYKRGVLNIGSFAYETSNFKNTNWKYRLSLMDRLVVFCNQQKDAIKDTFINQPVDDDKVHVIPHAIDIDKFSKQYDKIDFKLPNNCLKFYTICDFNRRKNISAMLLAYYSAFCASDNVVLILKTYKGGTPGPTLLEEIKSLCNNIKQGCARFNHEAGYPNVIVLPEYMSDDDIMSLHNTGDIYVSSSHGEAWNLPCTDALGMGNLCLTTDCGAFRDYLREPHGKLIPSTEAVVFGAEAHNGLYSAEENWWNINTKDLSLEMKSLYDSYNNNKEGLLSEDLREGRKEFVCQNFSREVVGKIYKEMLVNAIEA